jgi:ABC-type nitrate/sulfonate/bicarbonate transport system substrate-binding protein
MTLRKSVVVIGAYLSIVALASTSPAGSLAGAEEPLKIAYSMVSKETATAWVAEERGFFKKNGLATDMVLIQSGTTLVQALVGGDVDIDFTAPPAVVSAAAGGVDLKIVLGQANNMNFIIAAQPEIKKIQDIAGKKVGVSRTGSSTWIGLMMALEHYRMDLAKEKITIVNAGTDPARYAALTSRALDASVINPGFAPQLTALGFNVVVRLNDLGVPYTQGSLVTTKRFIQNQRDRVQHVVRAWVEAMQYCTDQKNRDDVLKILAAKLKLKDSTKASAHYQEILETYERKPYPSKAGLHNVIRFMALGNPKASEVTVDSITDMSFVAELDARGAFK